MASDQSRQSGGFEHLLWMESKEGASHDEIQESRGKRYCHGGTSARRLHVLTKLARGPLGPPPFDWVRGQEAGLAGCLIIATTC